MRQKIDVIRETSIYSYLLQYLIHNNFDDDRTREVARSFFTTLCFMYDITADTLVADNILTGLYKAAGIDYLDISEADFTEFMVEYIV